MKHKDKLQGVIIELDDGDKSTENITELHGKLADEADNDLVKSAIRILRDRGYRVEK